MYKHYIRINEDNEIIKVFCSVFESPIEGDMLFRESEERHFNKELINEDGFYIYRYNTNNNTIHKKTNNQIYGDRLPEYKQKIIERIKRKAYCKLKRTDWQIIRHENQIKQETITALTSQEYDNLIVTRQKIRDRSSLLESQVLAAANRQEILSLLKT